MSEAIPLALVVGFRDRDLQRVDRCLLSLAQQKFRDFQVIFVDYGSSLSNASAVRTLVEQYDFCRYLYTDTRGRPWSRSGALNIGGRLATSQFIMTSDIDIIFPRDFLSILMDNARADRILYCYPYWLPKRFQDWSHLDDYIGKLPSGNKHAYGGCQCITTEIFQQIRGFDERFWFWGIEDSDMYARLQLMGLQENWINEQTYLFHQWHPTANFATKNFMPHGVFGRMQLHHLRNQTNIVRNSENWGRVYTTADRLVFDFLDLSSSRLVDRHDLILFNQRPDSNHSIAQMARYFWNTLPSRHALAIDHAFYPNTNKLTDYLLRVIGKLTFIQGSKVQVDYSTNHLHNFLIEFVEQSEHMISDYYLNFPALDGVSVLVKT